MNEKKELIKSKLLNMDFDSLLETIREVNAYDYELEEYTFYDNDEEFFITMYENDVLAAVRAAKYGDYHFLDEYVLVNGYGNLDTYTQYQVKTLIYDDIEYISEIITDDFLEDKNYNLSFYDEL